jgi:hypothetical protein
MGCWAATTTGRRDVTDGTPVRGPRPGAPTQPPEGLLDGPVAGERVFDGEIVRLRVSEYVRPGGLRVRREVLDHHGAVVMVPLEDDHVLMVRQPREAVEEVMLELPAGKLDATDLRRSDVPPVPGEDIEVVPVPVADIGGLVERVRDAKTLVGLLRVARLLGV